MGKNKNLAQIGIFGGSGFYKFLDNIKEVKIKTPYGKTSDALMIGKIGNKDVASCPVMEGITLLRLIKLIIELTCGR